MEQTRLRISRAWIGPAVSLLVIAILVWTIDIRQAARDLAGIDLRYVVGFIILQVTSLYMRAARWRLFFPTPPHLSQLGSLMALCCGYAMNAVIPFRAGELVRIILVSEREHVKLSTAFATVLVEKVLVARQS